NQTMTRASVPGHGRPLLRRTFWLDSAEGAILGPHEPPIASFDPGLVAGHLGAGHDLRARRKGRHQNLFGPSDSRRNTGRDPARADLLGSAIAAGDGLEPPARGARARGCDELPLHGLLALAALRREFHESLGSIDLAGVESGTARRG